MTHRERAGEITHWLDAQARLRGIRLPADIRRDLVDAVEEQLDAAVTSYANSVQPFVLMTPGRALINDGGMAKIVPMAQEAGGG